MIDPELLAIARGDSPADLLLCGGRVINVFTGEIEPGNIAVRLPEGSDKHVAPPAGGEGGRIAGVGDYTRARRRVDLGGAYVAPGFIDAHMHVESTMLPPSEFVKLASPHGTTGVVLDPHEIANVLGIDGIRAIMDDAVGIPLDTMFALSSCVPASHLETSGARIEAPDLEPLFDDPRVVALAEMMNFPGIVAARPDLLAKVALGLRRHVVDGHAPGLRGHGLAAYVAAGISSDHECTTAEEALEKLRRGMHIFIREGSAARNLAALLPLVTAANRTRFSFCTDDRHPADLKHEGHIDHVVRKAVGAGLDPVTAISMASLHTADHYRRPDLGAIAPGRFADLIVFDDLADLRPRQVYFRGRLVAEDGGYLATPAVGTAAPRHLAATPGTVRLGPSLSEASFRVPARRAGSSGGTMIRVIGMDPHQIVTAHLRMPAKTIDGAHVADPARDILKLAVIERHTGRGGIGLGFVHGFGFRDGALASTVGHDSHNLTIVGTNDRDMLAAARALEAADGGMCVVQSERVLALLPLPIAGLMSDQPADAVIDLQARLIRAAAAIGCPHADPFMPLSFLPLPVIPSLKLTDRGLVDVGRFEIVPIEID